MHLVVELRVDGAVNRFNALAQSYRSLDPALRSFGGYLLKKFRGPHQFTALAESTLKERESRQEAADEAVKKVKQAQMRRKLVRELKRAQSKMGAVAAHNRYMVLKEFDRIVNGGSAAAALIDAKAAASLTKRIERAGGKGSSKILGRVTNANKAEVKNGVLRAGSTISWAQVHNEGGTAGHGAEIPQRTWIEVTSDDVQVLANLLEDYSAWSFANPGGKKAPKAFLRSG